MSRIPLIRSHWNFCLFYGSFACLASINRTRFFFIVTSRSWECIVTVQEMHPTIRLHLLLMVTNRFFFLIPISDSGSKKSCSGNLKPIQDYLWSINIHRIVKREAFLLFNNKGDIIIFLKIRLFMYCTLNDTNLI